MLGRVNQKNLDEKIILLMKLIVATNLSRISSFIFLWYIESLNILVTNAIENTEAM